MTMLVYAEALRFVYAISIRWPGVLTRVALLALVAAVILAAWRLRNPARKSAPHRVTPSRGKDLIANRRPGGVRA